VVNEPSTVALDDRTGEVQAVGTEAREMLGRTPAASESSAFERRRDCRLQSDGEDAQLLHPKGAPTQDTRAPRIIISVPSEITQVEKRAVQSRPTEPMPQTFTWWSRR